MVFSEADDRQFIDAFGQEVVFTLANGSTITCDAVFDDLYVGAGVGDLVIETSSPALTCITSDIDGLAANDTVSLWDSKANSQKTFNVVELQPNGAGITLVILSNQYNGS